MPHRLPAAIDAVDDAERHLVLSHYLKAEQDAAQALSLATAAREAPGAGAVADRAAVVLLQALFETRRFPQARAALCAAFGSLDAAPANPLLLWLSLALDTAARGEAQILVLQLLEAKAPAAAGWSRRQYLALLQLYCCEVLLPALREPAQVRLWLRRQPFLPLDAGELGVLEGEVEAAAAHAAQASSPGAAARRRSSACLTALGAPPPMPAAAAAAAAWGGGAGEPAGCADADDDCSLHSAATSAVMSPERAASLAAPPSEAWTEAELAAAAGAAARGSGEWARRGGGGRPRGAKEAAAAAAVEPVDELDWLGRWQRTAFRAAGAAYEAAAAALRPAPPEFDPAAASTSAAAAVAAAAPGEEGPAAEVLVAAAAAAAAAALVYAAWAERRALRRGVAGAGRGLARGAAEVARMALSLSPNPMAAARG
jgi:hypothetical protein